MKLIEEESELSPLLLLLKFHPLCLVSRDGERVITALYSLLQKGEKLIQ